MKIETKYDIGQEVWFMAHDCVVKGSVMSIDLRKWNEEVVMTYTIATITDSIYERFDSEIYASKEELLKSL